MCALLENGRVTKEKSKSCATYESLELSHTSSAEQEKTGWFHEPIQGLTSTRTVEIPSAQKFRGRPED